MVYPAKSALSRPCSECGGTLIRKTTNEKKPLGMVVCSGCPYTASIAEYAKGIQISKKAAAKNTAKILKGK